MQQEPIDNPFEDAVIGTTVDRVEDSEPSLAEPTRFSAGTYGLIALLGALGDGDQRCVFAENGLNHGGVLEDLMPLSRDRFHF